VAKDVDAEVIEGLRANFTGECTEVGMYLAMSRQADREGYPEVAEAYKRIAFEEAEHAAKFAELLGEVVDADTKTNLTVRVSPNMGPARGRRILLQGQNSLIWMPSTIPFMKCVRMRPGMAPPFAGLFEEIFLTNRICPSPCFAYRGRGINVNLI